MPSFRLVTTDADGVHLYEIVACERAPEIDLIDELAAELRALYTDVEDLAETLRAQLGDLGAVADEGRITNVLERVLAASIPPPGQHTIAHLDVARNELAELPAHLVLQGRYGTLVPASRIRHKEIPNAPARGLDLLGLEFDPLVGVATEVKASAEETSPPAVVGTGDDSLRGQYEAFLNDPDRMIAELNRLYKQADDARREAIAAAILGQVEGTLPIVVAPVLVRPRDRLGDSDFGCFRDQPDRFGGRPVRFSLVTVDHGLEDLAKAVYEKARS